MSTIEVYINRIFESSTHTTPEFKVFASVFKKELVKLLKGYRLLVFHRGHFDIFAFFENTQSGKVIYISTSDVRHFPDAWYRQLLIRTAQHVKDYTGGGNCYTTLPYIKKAADSLTS